MMAVADRRRLIVILACALPAAVAGAFLLGNLLWGGTNQPPPDEVPPSAPVKWEAARWLFVEGWTEAIGTTLPLPHLAARVTAPTEGRVVSLLQGADGKPI